MAIRRFFIKIHVCDKVVVCGQSVLTILFDVYISHLLCSTVLVYRLIENTQCVYNINLVFFVDTKEGFHVMDHMNYIATDRISKLPDHLQQHILSYLSINEVVQSSVLTKRWKNVWTVVPVLGFNTILFGSTDHKKNLDIQRKLQDFHIFVEKSLKSRHKQRLTLREFILTHGLDKRSLNSRVDCWINYVVKSDVKKLSLHFAAGYYDLPQSVLVAKSITVLILR